MLAVNELNILLEDKDCYSGFKNNNNEMLFVRNTFKIYHRTTERKKVEKYIPCKH